MEVKKGAISFDRKMVRRTKPPSPLGPPLGSFRKEAIKKRFKTFVDETSPVIEIFKQNGKLQVVNSEKSIDAVWAETQALFAGA